VKKKKRGWIKPRGVTEQIHEKGVVKRIGEEGTGERRSLNYYTENGPEEFYRTGLRETGG